MPDIDLQSAIDLPAAAVASAALQVLQDIQEGRRPFQNYVLAVRLRDDLAFVTVPVRIKVTNEGGYPPYEIGITLEALRHKGLFPKFEGTLFTRALEEEPKTQLELRGAYAAPIGRIGKFLDKTLLHATAENSLRAFLVRLIEAIAERVKHNEYTTARAMMRQRFS